MPVERLPGSNPRFDRWDKVGNIDEAISKIHPEFLPSFRQAERQYKQAVSYPSEWSLPPDSDGKYIKFIIPDSFSPQVAPVIFHWGDKTLGILKLTTLDGKTEFEVANILFSYTRLIAVFPIHNSKFGYVPMATEHPNTLLRLSVIFVAMSHAKCTSLQVPFESQINITSISSRTPVVSETR